MHKTRTPLLWLLAAVALVTAALAWNRLLHPSGRWIVPPATGWPNIHVLLDTATGDLWSYNEDTRAWTMFVRGPDRLFGSAARPDSN